MGRGGAYQPLGGPSPQQHSSPAAPLGLWASRRDLETTKSWGDEGGGGGRGGDGEPPLPRGHPTAGCLRLRLPVNPGLGFVCYFTPFSSFSFPSHQSGSINDVNDCFTSACVLCKVDLHNCRPKHNFPFMPWTLIIARTNDIFHILWTIKKCAAVHQEKYWVDFFFLGFSLKVFSGLNFPGS